MIDRQFVIGVTAIALMNPAARSLAEDRLTFEQHIRPILREHCFDCHGATAEIKGELDLRLVRFIIKGGHSGPAMVPGKPAESYLLKRLRSGEMPPGKNKVPADQIQTVESWVAAGAATARPEPESMGTGMGITPEERSFWSFRPISRSTAPTFDDDSRVRTPIDALVLAKMPEGLGFSQDADRVTLVRRAYLDLLGLPPEPEEMERWLAADSVDWYDRLLCELLDSPHYGERWARHWLDIAGYADSEGSTEADAVRPWAWKYRDWVIQSLNKDVAFDRFVTEQLAGDELASPLVGDLTTEQIGLLTATGFLRMAADGTGNGADSAQGRNQVITDTLKIVGTALLGLSVHCAQCHDHRYDPIPQTDYYGLRAVFEPALDWKNWKTPGQRLVSLYTTTDRQNAADVEAEAQKVITEKNKKQKQLIAAELEKQLKRVEDEALHEPLRSAYRTASNDRSPEQKKLLATYPFIRQLSPGTLYLYDSKAADQLKGYDKKLGEVRSKKPPEEHLRVTIEPPNHVPETKLFFRGDHEQPKQTVSPSALSITAPPSDRQEFATDDPSLPTTGRRLAFARWLTNGRHPLLARVIVNRLWMHHFGRGLVQTPADFGKLGARPTHPELLDWLADEFVRQGWSMKKLHRLIMSSTTWRQSGEVPLRSPDGRPASVDPANQYYWRKPVVRLEAEAICDRMLAASGQLNRRLLGRPIGIKEDDTGKVVVRGNESRRSLYTQVRRSRPVAILKAFDAPVMETNCESRSVSTVATQSLMLMNGDFILQQAAALAQRAGQYAKRLDAPELSTPDFLEAAAVRAWQLTLCRQPTADEMDLAMGFLDEHLQIIQSHQEDGTNKNNPEEQALTHLCQALLSSNEFLYSD